MLRKILAAIALSLPIAVAHAGQPPADAGAREAAAARLFELPAYRLLASRQIQQSLKFLPEPQYRKALAALDNPQVVQTLRQLIVRSMAQTYSTDELAFLERFMSAPQAGAFVAKLAEFEANLTRELIAASLSDPALAGILLGQ